MTRKKWLLLHSGILTRRRDKDEIISLLLKNRKIAAGKREEFLNPVHPAKLSPRSAGLKKADLEKAVKLIKKTKGKIIVYGDYDADGLCSTAIVWECLWQKGFDVFPYIPDREKEGHGLKKEAVKRLKKENPDLELIITVDNGIVAHQAVDLARSLGIKVVITDHHLLFGEAPRADAVIHTSRLAGSGVAWFLASQFGYRSLDLVSLGTIADIVPLIAGNRSFAKYGLRDLARSTRAGLRSLKKRAGLTGQDLLPWHVSYLLGPRLNAVARLSDPMDGLRLLCTKNQRKAALLAEKIEKLNQERQKRTLDGFDYAKAEVGRRRAKIIVVADKAYHQGLAGLIAQKLSEEYHRPAIVISQGEKESKGSARSINQFNIVESLRKAEDLLINVGGHPMAAGFTIENKNIKRFIKRMTAIAEKEIGDQDLIPEIKIDFEIDFSLITKAFYYLIQKLAPFGCGNPEPVFLLRKARVVSLRTMGNGDRHLKLYLDDPGTETVERVVAEAVGFGWGEWREKLLPGDLVDLVFTLDLNHWRGREALQLKIKDLKKSAKMLK